MGKIAGFPQARNADVLVVVVVVVDVQAARGEAPNHPKGTSADVHPQHQSQKQYFICPHPLYFIRRLELLRSFSPDISTKFCLDARYHDS